MLRERHTTGEMHLPLLVFTLSSLAVAALRSGEVRARLRRAAAGAAVEGGRRAAAGVAVAVLGVVPRGRARREGPRGVPRWLLCASLPLQFSSRCDVASVI